MTGIFKSVVLLILCAHSVAIDQTFEAYITEALTKLCPFQRSCLTGTKPYIGPDSLIPCCQECSCDEHCSLIGACCYDIPLNDSKVSTTLNIGCHPFVYMEDVTRNNGYEYLVVNKCLDDYDDEYTVNQCNRSYPETIKQAQLVSDESGRIYKNVYCARCNRVRDFIEWNVIVKCMSPINDILPDTETQYLLNNRCVMWLEQPKNQSFHALRCYTAEISTCNVTGHWRNYDPHIEEACETLLTGHYVIGRFHKVVFKNIFCFMCNSISGLDEGSVHCTDLDIDRLYYPFSAVLNFDDNFISAPDHSVICRDDEIYDGIKSVCRELQCPTMSYPTKGTCRRVMQHVNGYGLWICSSHTLTIFNSSSTVRQPVSEFHPTVLELSEHVEDYIINGNPYDCQVCGYFIYPVEHAGGMTASICIHVITTERCQLSDITEMAENLKRVQYNMSISNTDIQFASQNVTKAYIESAFNNSDSPGVLHHAFDNTCPTTMRLLDNSCAHIVLNGVEYLDALTKNHINRINHYSQYQRLRRYNLSELQNTSYEVCVDEYIVAHMTHGSAQSIAMLSVDIILTQTIMTYAVFQ